MTPTCRHNYGKFWEAQLSGTKFSQVDDLGSISEKGCLSC